ncbi:LamG-like jellyroll fold domain-containing protein [Chitinimonas koreensis]|uniref:LamG-like jellyroll fold domain-containing protein n=1 Tax=Chitinimonas koreensis TaxID=356302 RepID=UPI0004050614|nr:LamG-like jellyroll fold domain-containing protein [Chitinimonas koreensis]QNM94893.1 hypothetical protein H9L41_13275 [Chitinimonas koreensis]
MVSLPFSSDFSDRKGNTWLPHDGACTVEAVPSVPGGPALRLNNAATYLEAATVGDLAIPPGEGFTVEFDFYAISLPGYAAVLTNGAAGAGDDNDPVNGGFGVGIRSDGAINFGIGDYKAGAAYFNTVTTAAGLILPGSWYAVAVEHYGDRKAEVFVGGAQVSSTAFSATNNWATVTPYEADVLGLRVGSLWGPYYTGLRVNDFLLRNLRLTRHGVRYGADYTPAGGPFPGPVSVSGTVRDAAGDPVSRLVRVYSRDTGLLLGAGLSDPVTGAYSLPADVGELTVVCYDDDGNAQVYDHVTGV